jgi:hypothetical protein
MSEEATATVPTPDPIASLPADSRPVEDAKGIVRQLMDQGMTPQEISDGVEGRVSMRTIYRWARGESVPQNQTNFQALINLAASRGVY